MKKLQISAFFAAVILFVLAACQEATETPNPVPVAEEKPLFAVPKNFPAPIYALDKKPITQDGFLLGKTLFYDGILSRDGSISCGECHRQDFAFTHHLHDLSHGIDNQIGLRNAPPLHNLAWGKSFMWDGGVFDLDLFSVAPIENPVEMHEKLGNVLEKLRKSPTYPALFKKAFGTEEISTERFLKSLSQFMLSLVSANSRYDKYIRKEGVMLSSTELAGLELFKQKCAACHAGELFTNDSFRNNGLPIFRERYQSVTKVVDGVKKTVLELVVDDGRMRITELLSDKNKFKVPSLRNIEHTQPYMHDGRFATLQEVLNHYSDGVADTQNLDPILKQNGRLGIALTDTEKTQIIAFLRSLTDVEYLSDKRFTP